MTYFKHTAGESFTLYGTDYVGYFHVIDGLAYTEKSPSNTSELLTSKNTFLSEIYLNNIELDTNYKNVQDITASYSNSFDLLDYYGVNSLLESIDRNNLLCYKSLILSNPLVYNYDSPTDHFYGITNGDPDTIPPIGEYSVVESFDDSTKWGFLNDIKLGSLFVDSYENFKYICSDGYTTYILTGDFTGSESLTLISETPNTPEYNQTHQIYQDDDNKTMVFVKNDFIEVYDTSNYATCDQLILIDRIPLIPTDTKTYIWNLVNTKWGEFEDTYNEYFSTNNQNNPKFIKFGNNLRTGIYNNLLYLSNKYSDDIYSSIDLSNLGIGIIQDINIRNVDDVVVIVHIIDGEPYVIFIDPSDTSSSVNTKMYNIDPTNIKVSFSNNDSNVFRIYNNNTYQTRYISNPAYPSGRLETSNLDYPDKYMWNTATETYNFIPLKWNSGDDASNHYNTLLATTVSTNDKMYMLLHNVSRIYAMSQNIEDRHINSIPLDLDRYTNDTTCSESSLGLYLNVNIANSLKDTLNILNKARNSYDIREFELFTQELESIESKYTNFRIHSNETFNVISLQRILSTIYNIQNNILSKSVDN